VVSAQPTVAFLCPLPRSARHMLGVLSRPPFAGLHVELDGPAVVVQRGLTATRTAIELVPRLPGERNERPAGEEASNGCPALRYHRSWGDQRSVPARGASSPDDLGSCCHRGGSGAGGRRPVQGESDALRGGHRVLLRSLPARDREPSQEAMSIGAQSGHLYRRERRLPWGRSQLLEDGGDRMLVHRDHAGAELLLQLR
jgi:hypothetical protein